MTTDEERDIYKTALEYMFGPVDIFDWKRIVDERLTPHLMLPHHEDVMLKARSWRIRDALEKAYWSSEHHTSAGLDEAIRVVNGVINQPPASSPEQAP